MQLQTDFEAMRKKLAKQLASKPERVWTTSEAAKFVGKAQSRIAQIHRAGRGKSRVGRRAIMPTGQPVILLDGDSMRRLIDYFETSGRKCQ